MRAAQHPEAKAWTYKVLQNFRDGIDVVRLRDLPPPPPSKSCWAGRFLGGSRLELGMVLSSDPGMTFQARTSAEHGRLVLPPAQPKTASDVRRNTTSLASARTHAASAKPPGPLSSGTARSNFCRPCSRNRRKKQTKTPLESLLDRSLARQSPPPSSNRVWEMLGNAVLCPWSNKDAMIPIRVQGKFRVYESKPQTAMPCPVHPAPTALVSFVLGPAEAATGLPRPCCLSLLGLRLNPKPLNPS